MFVRVIVELKQGGPKCLLIAYLEYEVGEVEREHGADPDDLQSLSCVNRATTIIIIL